MLTMSKLDKSLTIIGKFSGVGKLLVVNRVTIAVDSFPPDGFIFCRKSIWRDAISVVTRPVSPLAKADTN